jgi:hypothetical protein
MNTIPMTISKLRMFRPSPAEIPLRDGLLDDGHIGIIP